MKRGNRNSYSVDTNKSWMLTRNYSVNIGPISVVGREGVQWSYCSKPAGAHRTSSRPTEFSTGSGFELLHRLRSIFFNSRIYPEKFHTVCHSSTLVYTPLHPLKCDCINQSGPLPDRPHIFWDASQNQRFKKILSALWIPSWSHVKQPSCSVSHWGNLWRSHVSCKSIKTSGALITSAVTAVWEHARASEQSSGSICHNYPRAFWIFGQCWTNPTMGQAFLGKHTL